MEKKNRARPSFVCQEAAVPWLHRTPKSPRISNLNSKFGVLFQIPKYYE